MDGKIGEDKIGTCSAPNGFAYWRVVDTHKLYISANRNHGNMGVKWAGTREHLEKKCGNIHVALLISITRGVGLTRIFEYGYEKTLVFNR